MEPITQEDQIRKFLAWWEHKFLQWFKEEGNKQFMDWLERNKGNESRITQT